MSGVDGKELSPAVIEAARRREEMSLTPGQRILRALELSELCRDMAAATARSAHGEVPPATPLDQRRPLGR